MFDKLIGFGRRILDLLVAIRFNCNRHRMQVFNGRRCKSCSIGLVFASIGLFTNQRLWVQAMLVVSKWLITKGQDLMLLSVLQVGDMLDDATPSDRHLRKIGIHVSAYIAHVRTQLKQTIPKAIVHCLVISRSSSLPIAFWPVFSIVRAIELLLRQRDTCPVTIIDSVVI